MTNDNNDELRRYIRNLEEQFDTSDQNEMRRDYDRRLQREMDTIRKRKLVAEKTSVQMNKSEAENYTINLKEQYRGKQYDGVRAQTTFTSTYKAGVTVPNMIAKIGNEEYQVDIKYDNPKDDPTYEFCEKVKKIGKPNIMKEFMKNVLDKFKNKGKNGYKILKYYFIYGIVKILTFIGIYDVVDKKENAV